MERPRVSLLELHDVRAGYGDAVVLDGISLSIPERGSLAVLGRNGVGKSTLLLTIMGLTKLHRGRVALAGKDIGSLAPHRRAQLGIGWVAQEREVFPSLSVEENLTVAARPGPSAPGARPPSGSPPARARERSRAPAPPSRCRAARAGAAAAG